jgi:hypothetical protein
MIKRWTWKVNIPTIYEQAREIPMKVLMRPHNFLGAISGRTIRARENRPDPPIPWIARKTMSSSKDRERPLAREKPANRTQQKMVQNLRPTPSLSRAMMTENPMEVQCVIIFGGLSTDPCKRASSLKQPMWSNQKSRSVGSHAIFRRIVL